MTDEVAAAAVRFPSKRKCETATKDFFLPLLLLLFCFVMREGMQQMNWLKPYCEVRTSVLSAPLERA